MATHKLAILVSAIGAGKAAKDLRGVDAAVGSIGSRAGQGLRTAGRNIAGIGVIAAAGIAVAVKSGLQDLATLESAVTSVDGAIKTVGLTGKVTGAQIAGWANDIERDIGAAFDDKDITASTTTLIRYGKVAKSNLRPAMVVMTDLAAKTGSVESASNLLAKSLADPTKAAGRLARQGIILTKQQQKQIDQMVKAGDVAGAQALVLDAVSKATRGAAAASQGPYARSLAVLADVSEDARKALATGFLPVIEKVADLLSNELGKKDALANIQKFGEGLAGGLDDLIDIAKTLPWQQIGDSFKLAGAGGKAILGAFASMPPWVQTAVLTGWGLNKLTGGALGGIVGELSKGLIKGVLGMTAAVVNLKAGVVNGGGGGGGVPGAPTGGGGIGQAVQVVAAGTIALGVGQGMRDVAQEVFGHIFPPNVAATLTTISNNTNPLANIAGTIAGLTSLPDKIGALPDEIGRVINFVTGTTPLPGAGTGTNFTGGRGGAGGGKGTKVLAEKTQAVKTAVDANKTAVDANKDGVVQSQGRIDRSVQGTRDAARQAGSTAARASQSAGTIISGNASGNAGRIVGAIAANRAVVSTNVNVYVSGSSITKTQSTTSRSSTPTSRNDDRHNP